MAPDTTPAAHYDRVHEAWRLIMGDEFHYGLFTTRECARVRRPGGRLVLCDIIRGREIPFSEIRARRADFATLRAAFGDAHTAPPEHYATLGYGILAATNPKGSE
jgi:hypothetical protein